MKLTINVFMLKSGWIAENAVASEVGIVPIRFSLQGTDCLFYHETSASQPKWLRLFSTIEEINALNLHGRSLKALMVMAVRDRVFCFTFGHARHLIDSISIERYFGLRTALSLTDPLLIKSVEKSSIDRTPLRSKSQSSKHLSIAEFDFKFDAEILKSLTGVIESEEEDKEYVSGSDSLALHSDIQLQDLPAIADRLLNAYEDERCREKYPWMDYIVPVRDTTLIARLDELLVEALNAQNFNQVRAAAPMILSDDICGFSYVRHNSRSRSGPVISFDLDLRQALLAKQILDAITLQLLHSECIHVYDANHERRDKWRLYECLEAEIEFDDKVYLLSEGDWYQIDRNYTDQINQYFENATRSDVDFPPYGTDNEGPYLRRVADNIKFYLLDQKLVRLNGASSPFEFCDLMTPDNDIIHVKKYSSSSVLSHLFSQAYVSAEALINAPNVSTQVNDHLAEAGDFRFEFDASIQPRNKIVFAIMQPNQDLHMPFFSKVNFRQFSQRLIAMGYRVEICRIPNQVVPNEG